ncbi:transmembrane protein 199 [Anthonomus grandis grandis]|uniref:transmembrane protein 199 n=1 Tax=Anthonomus grandis grandis TaxID=2921223 RepID=UPI002165025C|nr:transmembrane protein 199 [Anthonomus grandis grandis]
MAGNIGQIKNTQVLVDPSPKLRNFIKDIKVVGDNVPVGIQDIIYKNKPDEAAEQKRTRPEYLITETDKKFISSLNLKVPNVEPEKPKPKKVSNSSRLLSLHDLHWLHAYVQKQNSDNNNKIYLHELLEGSEVVLPKNELIPRNKELEKRCQKLKAEQQNREYANMTKNVDNFRKTLPEDTIGYQIKMMNKHLIAVFQFVVSVITGFAFGYVGVELLIGSLDFGVRMVLGIFCALTVATAELYFLLKNLNEDMEFENTAKKKAIEHKEGTSVKE